MLLQIFSTAATGMKKAAYTWGRNTSAVVLA